MNCAQDLPLPSQVHIKEVKAGQMWWHTPVIPAFGRQRQVYLCEFKANLGYIGVPGQQGLFREKEKQTNKPKDTTKAKTWEQGVEQYVYIQFCAASFTEARRWEQPCSPP